MSIIRKEHDVLQRALSALVLVGLAGGCTGVVGGSSATDDGSAASVGVAPGVGSDGSMPGAGSAGAGAASATGSGATGSGEGGSGATGATGSGATGSGNPTPQACTPEATNQVAYRVLTRLNRAEYDNTARDLLGDSGHTPQKALPADFGDGAFDNNAAALTIDPSLVQQYTSLAETLAENALKAGSAGRALVLTCPTTDETCARKITSDFAVRAWRRPLAACEADRLFALYSGARSAGFSFEQGVQTVLEGALLSPNFLFRPEIDAELNAANTHAVGPYELATRLSYFLWSSMPDSELSASAKSGALATADGLTAQLARMWSSPKAEAIYSRFPGQWLHTLDIAIAKTPSGDVFPQFTPAIKSAMEGETARFMRELMTGDADFLDFIDGKFTYLNATLAQFYGISGTFGTDFSRVDLSGNSQRSGILTQAAFLTLTSPPERTSPVMRGQWVLARLLNQPPPAPPNDVPPLDTQQSAAKTMRERMTAHRANPACAACHTLMDPIGFGLENYDGIGRFRTSENSVKIDATGELDSGKSFDGALALEALLRNDPRVPRAVVSYLTSYAIGRELGAGDKCLVDSLTDAFKNEDKNRMSALVKRVAALPVMQLRRGAP